MNQLAPLPSPALALPALVAAADERARLRFLASLIHDARFRVRSGHLLRLAVLRGRPASLAFVSPHSD
jgi:hypothetical protein